MHKMCLNCYSFHYNCIRFSNKFCVREIDIVIVTTEIIRKRKLKSLVFVFHITILDILIASF